MTHPVLMIEPAAFRAEADAYEAVRKGLRRPEPVGRVLNLPGRLAEDAPPEYSQPNHAFRAGHIGIVQATGPMWYSASAMAALMGYGSVSGIIYGLDRHLADPAVRFGVLDIQSPGGEAQALPELADAVRRFTAQKPLYARLSGNVYSLGYAAACLCTQISIGPGSMVGSIGSIISILDDSEALAREGLRFVSVSSSPGKLRMAPGRPIGEEAIAELQEAVDHYGRQFFELVAEGRGLAAEAVRALDGDRFFADKAKELGLVDVVETEHAFWARMEAAQHAAVQASGGASRDQAGNQARNQTGRVAPKSAGGAARTAKGVRMSATANRGGVAKNMTAKALIEKMKDTGEWDDEMISKASSLIEEDDETTDQTHTEETENRVRAATFQELERAVPKNLADRDMLIAKMQREGACLTRAAAIVQEALLAELAAVKGQAQNQDHARRAVAPYQKGRDPVPGSNRGNGTDEDPKAQWDRLVNELAASGVARNEAARRVNLQHPELRKALVAAANPQRQRAAR